MRIAFEFGPSWVFGALVLCTACFGGGGGAATGASATPDEVVAGIPGEHFDGSVPPESGTGSDPHIEGPTTAGPVAPGDEVNVEFQFSDPDADIMDLLVGAPGAAEHVVSTTTQLEGVASGTMTKSLQVPATAAGSVVFVIAIRDRAGHVSNHLTITVSVLSASDENPPPGDPPGGPPGSPPAQCFSVATCKLSAVNDCQSVGDPIGMCASSDTPEQVDACLCDYFDTVNACIEEMCPGSMNCGYADVGAAMCSDSYPCLCGYAPAQITTQQILDACGPNSCMTLGADCCPAGSGWFVNGGCHGKELTAYELCQSSGGICPDSVTCVGP